MTAEKPENYIPYEEYLEDNADHIGDYPDTPLKDLIVQYCGGSLGLDPDVEGVTIQMVVDVLAGEFPEVVLAIAEENYFRGFKARETMDEAVEEDVKELKECSEEI